MRPRIIASVTVAAALFSGSAFAQRDRTGEAAPVIDEAHEASGLRAVPIAPRGLTLQAGGGVTAFSRQAARDQFGTGGYWDARAVFGSRSFIGAEVAYVGSARGIKAGGVSDNAALVGNGAEAVVRANLPLQVGNLHIEPFVFGGAGWTYYQMVNSDTNSSGIKDNANAFVVPFGGGVSGGYKRFIVDARFTYRSVFDDDLVPTGNDRLDLQNWSAGMTLGFQL